MKASGDGGQTNRRHQLQGWAGPGRGRSQKGEPGIAAVPRPCPRGTADAGVGAV